MTEQATFAAGCFWGVEAAFHQRKGVKSTLVGYTGGSTPNPTYEEVCTGRTGHAEAVRVEFDPAEVSYKQLLDLFWGVHDPTTLNRQGPDVGTQYRSAIFFHDAEQEAAARASKETFEKSGNLRRPIVTEIVPAGEFYPAEEYHQQYFETRGIASCRLPYGRPPRWGAAPTLQPSPVFVKYNRKRSTTPVPWVSVPVTSQILPLSGFRAPIRIP